MKAGSIGNEVLRKPLLVFSDTGGTLFRRIASTACSCISPSDLSRGGEKDMQQQPFVEG